MEVRCPQCSAVVPAEDVNIARVLAKCRACNAVFNFGGQLGLPKASAVVPLARVALPPGIQLLVADGGARASADPYRGDGRRAGELTLTRKWFSASSIFLLFFSTVWFAFLAFWYKTAFTGNAPWIFFVFPLVHVGAGFMILHRALTGLLNTTTIRIANGRMTVRHGPIPTFGNREIALGDLRQLYTVTKTKNDNTTYELHAITAVGPTVKLMSGLTEVQQALYVERVVEDHLGIEDDPTANQRI